MTYTVVADAIVPVIYNAYMTAFTEEKSALVQSGAVVRSSEDDQKLAGGGLLFHMPSWKDLGNDAANVSTGSNGAAATPLNIGSFDELAARLSRNQTWGAADLVAALAGSNPMQVIAARLAPYWARELERTVLAQLAGIFADNDANNSGDFTHDVSGVAYSAGVTDFTAEAFIDALQTIGDSSSSLGITWMHSKVLARAKKNNLIDFRPDSSNPDADQIPFFLGRRVIEDDSMPNTAGVYQTFILGQGAIRWGVGSPDVPLEQYRLPLADNGGGNDAIISRVEWLVHPRGMSYTGTPANGGPSNASTANNFAHVDSWTRVVPERKQVKVARLITRENA